jgi:kynurenine formamidase
MHTMKNTFVAALLVLGMASAIAAAGAQPGLWDTLAMLKTRRWVDLTHTFDENSPHWKGFSPLKRTIPYDYAKDGFRVELTTHVGQWGTHMDAPNHFHAGKRSVDQIELQEMLLPLVVIDIHAQVDKDPITPFVWKTCNSGKPPMVTCPGAHSSPCAPTGPSVGLTRPASRIWMQPEWPTIRAGAKRFCAISTKRVALRRPATKPTDTDPGLATSKDDYSLEAYILGQNRYQIELLTNLDQVPQAGALISVTTPKLRDGVGFPARVFAILP